MISHGARSHPAVPEAKIEANANLVVYLDELMVKYEMPDDEWTCLPSVAANIVCLACNVPQPPPPPFRGTKRKRSQRLLTTAEKKTIGQKKSGLKNLDRFLWASLCRGLRRNKFKKK